MYADDTTLNFYSENFDPTCIEAGKTNRVKKMFWLKLN